MGVVGLDKADMVKRRAPENPLALVNVPDQTTLLADIEHCLDARRGFAVATLNLDHAVKMRRSTAFFSAYSDHTHVVADGNPIVWLARLAGRGDIRLVPGSELITPLVELAARKRVPIGFLGSTEEALRIAADRLGADHPGISIVARIAPPFGFDPAGAEADRLLDAMAASGARLCFLALGAPKQEILAARGLARHPGLGFVSIGAGLDFIAGHQTRAPKWVRRLALEWLWRLLSNPRRLARRYFDCIVILPSLARKSLAARRASDAAIGTGRRAGE